MRQALDDEKGVSSEQRSETHDKMIPLSTDWLAVSIRLVGDVARTPAHHTWVLYEGGTNVWSKRRVLFNQYGEKVLTLLSAPKSSLIDPAMALVEIANEWLYHGQGVRQVLIKLRYCVYFEVVSLSRLDLCVDFVPNARMRRQIVGMAKGALEVCGKRNGSGFWSINTDEWMPDEWRGKRCPHCISWGHKESDVKWKLYYKSKELRDAAGGRGFDKPYIVDLWRECGLDVDSVWRLEVSIKHCNKLVFNGLKLDLGVWGNNTKELFEALYTSRFQLSHGGNRKAGGRVEHIPFLPVDHNDAIKCRTYDGSRSCSARISLLRSLVRSVETEEVLLDSPTRCDVLATIDGIVKRDRLERYFEGMVGVGYDEWVENVNAAGGPGRLRLVRNTNDVTAGLHPNDNFDMRQAPMA